MKTRTIEVAGSYLKLIFKFPLRPIRSRGEYDMAVAVMEKLAVRGENDLDDGERDYTSKLSRGCFCRQRESAEFREYPRQDSNL